jgi:hypothetical protein
MSLKNMSGNVVKIDVTYIDKKDVIDIIKIDDIDIIKIDAK